MNGSTISILLALAVQLALGLAVLRANWTRKSNQSFFILSLAAGVWLASLYFAFTASDTRSADLSIRAAFVAAALIFTSLNLLRLSIRYRDDSWSSLLSKSRYWILIAIAASLFCQTSFFLHSAELIQPLGTAPPRPIYGKGAWIYMLYFALAIVVLVVYSWRDVKLTSGAEHIALAFLSVGGVLVIAFPVILSLLLRAFIEPSKLLWFAPFRVVLFSLVVAYGIATRKIIDVGFFLRRVMSYVVLGAYLLALYALVWWLVVAASSSLFHSTQHGFAHVTAALVICFAMAPARGVSQSLAEKLFVGTRGIDFRATISKAAAILESVTTLPDLLRRFATTIGEAVGTDSVTIYLQSRKGFVRSYSNAHNDSRGSREEIPADSPLVNWLRHNHEPVILDELHRIRASASSTAVRIGLETMKVAAALGIFSREHLVGIMLLGPRLSGRIYGSVEQNALQILCGQLAVAIENAELFTEVQNAKIYNEILLQNLTTGVIAADVDGRISVFNSEAEKITGLTAKMMVGKSMADLPGAFCDILETTLASGERQEGREIYLRSRTGGVYARASSSTFHGQDRQLLGALAVVTDITDLKRLELQIRRSDRLASLGTLSAGMAHEIKNPLVSIKTFAQLLPERYSDSDFRDTFSNLIVHEINRIDSLVNQLLRFARPAKPLLRPMHVHEVLEKTLLLVQHRLYQKEIKLTRSWDADVDTIRADADQLEQVFLNFFLNAMDAMRRGGELTVGTQVLSGDLLVTELSPDKEDTPEALSITIRDTGDGIRAEDIPHVFDPFFTTKDYGTGLGLSVVHGIIEEHGGQIEVESELSKGTAFHILLPLVRFEEKVVVA